MLWTGRWWHLDAGCDEVPCETIPDIVAHIYLKQRMKRKSKTCINRLRAPVILRLAHIEPSQVSSAPTSQHTTLYFLPHTRDRGSLPTQITQRQKTNKRETSNYVLPHDYRLLPRRSSSRLPIPHQRQGTARDGDFYHDGAGLCRPQGLLHELQPGVRFTLSTPSIPTTPIPNQTQ